MSDEPEVMHAMAGTHEYHQEALGELLWVVDPVTGAKDLIYDPKDPTQIAPFGCLINSAESRPGGRDLISTSWELPESMAAFANLEDLPDHILLGPKSLAGGLGMGIFGTCRQRIGDCTAACASNIAEGTLKSEQVFGREDVYHPEISIGYIYYGAQAAFGQRPGGDGATTKGLAMTLQGYAQTRYANFNGRYGGVVHEAPFEGVTDPNLASGYPYDPINVERPGKAPPTKWIEFGLKHTCGDGNGDCRAVTSPEAALQVWASGHGFFTGIQWPSSWIYCDKNGFLTKPLSYASSPGGHEVGWVGYIRRPATSGYGGSNTSTRNLADGQDLWYDMMNSWGLEFGHEGHVLVPASQAIKAGVFREAYTISYVKGWDRTIVLDWLKLSS